MKVAKYLYISMIVIMAMVSAVMIYNQWVTFGLFLLVLCIASVINVIDIVSTNSETKFAQEDEYNRRRNFNKKLTTKQKQKYISQLEKELADLKK